VAEGLAALDENGVNLSNFQLYRLTYMLKLLTGIAPLKYAAGGGMHSWVPPEVGKMLPVFLEHLDLPKATVGGAGKFKGFVYQKRDPCAWFGQLLYKLAQQLHDYDYENEARKAKAKIDEADKMDKVQIQQCLLDEHHVQVLDKELGAEQLREKLKEVLDHKHARLVFFANATTPSTAFATLTEMTAKLCPPPPPKEKPDKDNSTPFEGVPVKDKDNEEEQTDDIEQTMPFDKMVKELSKIEKHSVNTDDGPPLTRLMLLELIATVQQILIKEVASCEPDGLLLVTGGDKLEIMNYKEIVQALEKGKQQKAVLALKAEGETTLRYFGKVVDDKIGSNLPRASSMKMPVEWKDKNENEEEIAAKIDLYIDGSKNLAITATDCCAAFLCGIEKAPPPPPEKEADKDEEEAVVAPSGEAAGVTELLCKHSMSNK